MRDSSHCRPSGDRIEMLDEGPLDLSATPSLVFPARRLHTEVSHLACVFEHDRSAASADFRCCWRPLTVILGLLLGYIP